MKIGSILKNLVKEIVTVELKNGLVVSGILLNADKYMNLYLKKTQPNYKKNSPTIEYILIRGSTIRYIILPIWLNLDSILIFQKQKKKIADADNRF